MSAYAAFRRQPVNPQVAQNLRSITIPAPTRGIIQSENEAFMQPGGAVVQENWATTMKGVKVRGGYVRWCDLHAAGVALWVVSHAYAIDDRVYDTVGGSFWKCAVAHTSTPTGTFALERQTHPGYWLNDNAATTRLPVISAFEYVGATGAERMYAANATTLYDVTAQHAPTVVKTGQASGNYSAAQMNNAAGENFMVVVNDAGDFALRTDDGDEFFLLSGVIGNAGDGIPNLTYDPAKLPTGVAQGTGLTYVWKYRNRLYFIQKDSMTAWYLDPDAVGGVLKPIYLQGAANKGGRLLFGASWSIDAGDGTDDKNVFVTNLGEVLVFTGSNPSDAANWRQEGRYQIGAPLGMNGHMLLGGDLIILTVDGATPLSQAIAKDSGSLELALLTKNIKPLWRDEVYDKRDQFWTIRKWDEYGGIFIAAPLGSKVYNKHCLVANNETGAWFVYTWDATCFLRMRELMFFGTRDGKIMWADRGGHDDGRPYTATLVGGWETFQSGSAQVTWHQARAIFLARASEPFQPQLTSAVDYVVSIPPPPPIGPNVGQISVWDEGLWNQALWDADERPPRTTRNTLWVSIGTSGFAHAPVVQAQIKQDTRPTIELIAIGTTQERGGVNV